VVTQPSEIGTRDQILDAALELFTTQGYDATSLRQIAERLRLTKAALYYHFPAKELLLLELTRPLLDGMSHLVTELRASQGGGAQDLLAGYLDLFIAHRDVLGLLARDPATLHHPDIGQRARALILAVQQLLSGPDPSSERAVRSACAMGVVNAIPTMPADALEMSRDTILAAALGALGEPTPRAGSLRRR
jgi:AcrR family transcriptional regulator